jgi:hypothetical protein
MNQEELKFIYGVLAHFYMDTSSITQRKKAIAIMNKLQREMNL